MLDPTTTSVSELVPEHVADIGMHNLSCALVLI